MANESKSAGSIDNREANTRVTHTDKSPINTSTGLESVPVYLDGGWRAWLVVLGVWIVQFSTFGYTNAFGVYNDFYVREYLRNYDSSQISWIGSIQLFFLLSAGLFTGRAFDAGYFFHVMLGGTVLFVFCLFMLSLTQPEQYYQVFLAHGLGVGAAAGVTYVPGLAVISHWFQKRRSLAIGIATSGSAVGGLLHPIMLNKWFYGPLGFRAGVRVSAGLNGGLLAIALLLMKTRLPPSGAARNTVTSMKAFLTDPAYAIMVVGTTVVLAGLYYPFFFVQLEAIKNGAAPTLAFYTVAILNGASVFGRTLPNLLVPTLGVFNVVIPCVFLCALLVFCTFAIQNLAGTLIFTALFGFFSGAYVGMLAPMVSSLAETDSEIGVRLGVCFTFTGLGGLVGTPIAGALLSSHLLWWRPVLFSGICILFGALCFCTTRILKARRKGTQRV